MKHDIEYLREYLSLLKEIQTIEEGLKPKKQNAYWTKERRSQAAKDAKKRWTKKARKEQSKAMKGNRKGYRAKSKHADGSIRMNSCSVCGGIGHNARTCTVLDQPFSRADWT